MKQKRGFLENMVLGALVMAYAKGAFTFMDKVTSASNDPIMIPVMIILALISFILAGYGISWLVDNEVKKPESKRW